MTCFSSRIRASLMLAGVAALALPACAADPTHYAGRTEYLAPHASVTPNIDGVADEPIWNKAQWQAIDQRWLGPEYTAEDFQGRFKVVWTASKLYILGEFVDDVLIDTHRDPLVQYWDDDCLEIFLDEDFSGGDHQFNHNAFAYHVALDNQTVDIGTDKKPRNYTHHVHSRWQQQDNKIVWELAIDVYPDTYVDGARDNMPATLAAGKQLGLMVAYCDNDGSEVRENFVGSEFAPDELIDRGWIDAGLFGSLRLTP